MELTKAAIQPRLWAAWGGAGFESGGLIAVLEDHEVDGACRPKVGVGVGGRVVEETHHFVSISFPPGHGAAVP